MSWKYLDKTDTIGEDRAADIIRSPVITEKSTRLSALNHYLFYVARSAGKRDVKNAIEKLFKVKVVKVRTLNQTGKRRRFRNITGKRPDFKKAYVTLAAGEQIDYGTGS